MIGRQPRWEPLVLTGGKDFSPRFGVRVDHFVFDEFLKIRALARCHLRVPRGIAVKSESVAVKKKVESILLTQPEILGFPGRTNLRSQGQEARSGEEGRKHRFR